MGFSQSTICLTSWVSSPLVIAFNGFCPSYSLQANNPDSRNREGSVLFTSLITLNLALVTFQPLHYSDYIKSCCSLLSTTVHYSDYIFAVGTFHSSIVPDIILEFSLINNLDSRIRDVPVLHPVLVTSFP